MPAPQTLLIRTDANQRMGWGHFMRCLAVAQSWREQGGHVHFICCDSDRSIHQRLHDASISFDAVGCQPGGKADLAYVQEWVNQYRPNWILLDHYEFTNDYIRQLKGDTHRIAAFDDGCGERDLPVDIVINGNLHAIRSAVTYNQPIRLLGPRFMALRAEVLGNAVSTGDHENQGADGESNGGCHEQRQRLLITLGGAATEELLIQILATISQVTDKPSAWDVRLLLGSLGNDVQASLRKQLQYFGIVGDCLTSEVDVGFEYQQAGLAISAGGSTLYELAYHGVPTLVITTAENQTGSVQALAESGLIRQVAHPAIDGGESLAQNLTEWFNDSKLRQTMILATRGLVDGLGANRIAKRMAGEPQMFRAACLSDAKNLLKLRNDPAVRTVSLSSALVAQSEHLRWLTAKLADSNCQLLVLEAQSAAGETEFWGQIRFDLCDDFREATISIALVREVRGLGLASGWIQMACTALLKTHPGVVRFVALIRPENQASLHVFASAGFGGQDDVVAGGICCRRLTLGVNRLPAVRSNETIIRDCPSKWGPVSDRQTA